MVLEATLNVSCVVKQNQHNWILIHIYIAIFHDITLHLQSSSEATVNFPQMSINWSRLHEYELDLIYRFINCVVCVLLVRFALLSQEILHLVISK